VHGRPIPIWCPEDRSACRRSVVHFLSPEGWRAGRCGADNTVASRLLQFFRSLQKVLVDRTADEFGHRSASFRGQHLQLLDLLFFEEEGRALHGHIVPYRHTKGNSTSMACGAAAFVAQIVAQLMRGSHRVTQANSTAWIFEVSGSGPGGRWFKSNRPDQSLRISNLQNAKIH
jgi:hypothetical protein